MKDTCSGFLEIFKSNNLFGTATNIGMNQEISIGDLVHKFSGLIGVNVTINSDKDRVRPNKSEVDRLMCDNSKLLEHTNWKPKYDLNAGLKETIEWIKSNRELFKPDTYSV